MNMNWFKQLSKTQIILGIFAIIIIYLLYTNYIQSKQIIDHSSSSLKELKEINETRERMTTVSNHSGKSQLVLYYANWCSWSQKFLPTWEQFKKYAHDNLSDKLTVKDIECDKSADPVCKQVGFPTVKLLKPDSTEIVFDGERSVQGLTQFCSQNL